MLTEEQVQRFSRHILLREVGGVGQEALLRACVRIPSLDAAGRSCALWLARAGIGALELPDDVSPAPVSDESGLLLAADVGRPLIEAVCERLRFHSPGIRFERDAAAGLASSISPIAFTARPEPAVFGRVEGLPHRQLSDSPLAELALKQSFDTAEGGRLRASGGDHDDKNRMRADPAGGATEALRLVREIVRGVTEPESGTP